MLLYYFRLGKVLLRRLSRRMNRRLRVFAQDRARAKLGR